MAHIIIYPSWDPQTTKATKLSIRNVMFSVSCIRVHLLAEYIIVPHRNIVVRPLDISRSQRRHWGLRGLLRIVIHSFRTTSRSNNTRSRIFRRRNNSSHPAAGMEVRTTPSGTPKNVTSHTSSVLIKCFPQGSYSHIVTCVDAVSIPRGKKPGNIPRPGG
jgi:hypothetical protein